MRLQLNTKTKIGIARLAYCAVIAWRRLLGRNNVLDTTREGIRWRLDLREGIDLSLYLFGQFERDTVRAYRRLVRAGDTVLDIGANIGAHTLPLARTVGANGRVIAFEPTAYAFGKLLANIALNPDLARVIEPKQLMLVDGESASTPPAIYSSWPLTEESTTQHPTHLGLPMSTAGAAAKTLDDYIASTGVTDIRFAKIDVDGHECAVLRGALQTLRRDKPVLLMELMPYGLTEAGTSLDELLDLLDSAGYRLFRLNGLPLPGDNSVARYIPRGGSINVICRGT